MPSQSFTRRRIVALLALTSIMLVTLDLRGSGAATFVRSTFGVLFRPFEAAVSVIVRPVQNAWNGMVNYDAVVDENRRLRDLVAFGEGASIAAIASLRESQELLALNGLPSLAGIGSCTAQVVGQSPSNFSQTVELNKGSECGMKVGMPVLNAAGLIGKITKVYEGRAVVMLITDPSYALAVKVVNAPEGGLGVPSASSSTSTTTTTSTTIPGFTPGLTIPVTTAPGSGVTAPASTASPITVPKGQDLPLRETGALEGRGLGKPPIVRFVEYQPRFGEVRIGSPVISAGGATSLAPPDIVIGTVSKIVLRTGTLGPLLEVKLTATLDALNFVRVLLYQPLTERQAAP